MVNIDKPNKPDPRVGQEAGEEDKELDLENLDDKKKDLEGQIDANVDTFQQESRLNPGQEQAANKNEKESLDSIDMQAENAGKDAKKEMDTLVKGESKSEDIKNPEFKKFFAELTLEDFQNLEGLKEKFKAIFTEAQLNTLMIDKSVQESAKERYFNNFIQSAEQYLQRQVAQQAAKAGEEHKTRGAAFREIKKFGKGVFGGGLYALASRGVNSALRFGTTSALPLKILAGGVTGAAVSGFNWATGRAGEKLTGKNIQKLARELAKTEGRDQIERDLRATFDRDLGVLMTFDRDRDKNLNTAQQELSQAEAEQLNSMFSSGNAGQKKKDLIELMKLTSKAKNLTGVGQAEAIETRQEKIKNLIDNQGLDEYVTNQINIQLEQLKKEKSELNSTEQQALIKQASIMVEQELNSILGDVTAKEKFAEIDKKGKSFFERGYAAKLLGKEPPQNAFQAMRNGFISGATASLATTDATMGAIYMAMQRVQGTLRSEILKHEKKIVKTADEIEKDLIHTNVALLKEGQVRDRIRDARARIKLPDIKEIERAKIEAQITRLENQLLQKDLTSELTADSDLKIEALAHLAVGRRQEEIAEAASLAEKEKQSKSFIGLAQSFWQIGYTKKEGELGIKAFGKHLVNKEKAKILLKTGYEGIKGGVAGALGGEIVNMGGVAFAGGDVDIESLFGRVMDRASFGLYQEARESLGEDQLKEKQVSRAKEKSQTVLDSVQTKFLENQMDNLGVDSKLQESLIGGVDNQDQALALQSRIQELSDNLERSGANPEQIKALVSQADTPEELDQLSFVAENPSLSHTGFKLDYTAQGVDATLELGKEGAPKHLEQAFCRLAMDQVDLKDGLTNVEGSQVLNIGANLRVLAQGHDVAGVSAADFDQYVDIVNGKVFVRDFEGFKAQVLEPLANHAEEIITQDNVAHTGAVAYLDNIAKETWHDMASSVGVADKISFDQSMIDHAEQALVAGDLKDSGLGEFIQEAKFADEANGTFKLFDQTVEVKGRQVVSIAGQKLEHPIAFGTKKGGDALMDRALDNKIAALNAAKQPGLHIRVSEGPTELKPILDIERIPDPAVQESEFKSMLRDAGLKNPDEVQWYLDKPTTKLLEKSLDPGSPDMGDPDWTQDASYDMDKLRRIISRAVEEKIINPPAPGEKIEDTLDSIAIKYATHPEDQFVGETLHKCGMNRFERMVYSDEKVGEVMSGKDLAHEGAIRGPWESRDVGRLRNLIQEKANDGSLPGDLNSEDVKNMAVEDLLKSVREKEMAEVPTKELTEVITKQPEVAGTPAPGGAPENLEDIKAGIAKQSLDPEKYDYKEVGPGRIEATPKTSITTEVSTRADQVFDELDLEAADLEAEKATVPTAGVEERASTAEVAAKAETAFAGLDKDDAALQKFEDPSVPFVEKMSGLKGSISDGQRVQMGPYEMVRQGDKIYYMLDDNRGVPISEKNIDKILDAGDRAKTAFETGQPIPDTGAPSELDTEALDNAEDIVKASLNLDRFDIKDIAGFNSLEALNNLDQGVHDTMDSLAAKEGYEDVESGFEEILKAIEQRKKELGG